MPCERSQRKKRREERAEKEQQTERENKMLEQQMMILEQKKKLLEMQTGVLSKEEKNHQVEQNEDKTEIKETTFESPTAEEIKQLMKDPTALSEKKES